MAKRKQHRGDLSPGIAPATLLRQFAPVVGQPLPHFRQKVARSEDRTNDNGDEEHQGAIRPGATGWGIHRRNDCNGSEEPYCDIDPQKGKGITRSIPLSSKPSFVRRQCLRPVPRTAGARSVPEGSKTDGEHQTDLGPAQQIGWYRRTAGTS
jgi:hypothetical protein